MNVKPSFTWYISIRQGMQLEWATWIEQPWGDLLQTTNSSNCLAIPWKKIVEKLVYASVYCTHIKYLWYTNLCGFHGIPLLNRFSYWFLRFTHCYVQCVIKFSVKTLTTTLKSMHCHFLWWDHKSIVCWPIITSH